MRACTPNTQSKGNVSFLSLSRSSFIPNSRWRSRCPSVVESRKRPPRDVTVKFTFDDTPSSHQGAHERSYHHGQRPRGTCLHGPLTLCDAGGRRLSAGRIGGQAKVSTREARTLVGLSLGVPPKKRMRSVVVQWVVAVCCGWAYTRADELRATSAREIRRSLANLHQNYALKWRYADYVSTPYVT